MSTARPGGPLKVVLDTNVYFSRSSVRVSKVVEPRVALQVINADPDDDRILECAVAGGADLIVSGDQHLTRLKNFEGIGIVRPAYFLKILG
jgi:predicted nucleic acid-binding protein